jgi:DNA-binding MarR family transcriptional regulator
MIKTKGEIKVLKALLNEDRKARQQGRAESGLTPSAISQAAKIQGSYVAKYLNTLEKEGLITKRIIANVTIISLNKDSPKIQAVWTLWG